MNTMNIDHTANNSTISTLDAGTTGTTPVTATTAITGNDNATPATPSRIRPRDPRALLADPSVVRAIRDMLLRQGMPMQDLRDGVAEVQLRALKATKDRPAPTDVAEWRALCCTIAERMMITNKRREKRRARFHGELGKDEGPDDYAPIPRSPGRRRDPVDMSRQIAVLRGQFEAGEMPLDGDLILFRTADGFSAKEIGDELGISQSAVEGRLARMRRNFRLKLASLGMLVLLLLLAILLSVPFGALATRDDDPPPVPPPTTVPTVTPHSPPSATALRPARELDDEEREIEAKPRP
jgi:DNA-directed RNA polymerase specialized sigma24 family protein